MGELEMLERKPPRCRLEHQIEDSTPGSGHMQVCHPSPATGLFEPHVRLGDHVQRDQTIGIIREPNPTIEHVVTADRSGIVIVLRTFPRVREGESVGVVVDLHGGRTAVASSL
jgi:predicted deacylase